MVSTAIVIVMNVMVTIMNLKTEELNVLKINNKSDDFIILISIVGCCLKAGLSESRHASIAMQQLANTHSHSNQQTQKFIATQRLASYAIASCGGNNWTRLRCNKDS
jgi:hypothetical protein